MWCPSSFSASEAKALRQNVLSLVSMDWVNSGRKSLTFHLLTLLKLSQRFTTECLRKRRRKLSFMNFCTFQVVSREVFVLTRVMLNAELWKICIVDCRKLGL